MIHHITRTTKVVVFLALVISAILMTSFRLLLPKVREYKVQLETEITRILDAPVKIGKLSANMRGFAPQLLLKDIDVLSDGVKTPVIQLREIRLGVNLLEIVEHLNFMSPAWVTLVGANLSVTREMDGSISVEGLKSKDEKPLWLLQGGRFEVLQSEVTWRDEILKTPPQTFKNADIVINNDFSLERHRLHMRFDPPRELGDSLILSLDLKGDIFSSGGINGKMYAEGKNIHLDKLLGGRLSSAFSIRTGTSDFRLWSEWSGSRLVAMAGKVLLNKTRITRQDRQAFPIERMSGWFKWRRNENAWRIDVNRFVLDTGTVRWPETNFSLKVSGAAADPNKTLGVAVSSMDLDELTRIVSFVSPLKIERFSQIEKFSPKGTVRDFTLYAEAQSGRFYVDGAVEHLRLLPVDRYPAIKNLSARFNGTDRKGSIDFATENAEIHFRGLFRAPLAVDRLRGGLNWIKTENGWEVSSPLLILDTPAATSKSRLRLGIPAEGGPVFVDLQSRFQNGDGTRASPYLPTGIMNKKVVDWLDEAFVKGKVPQGGLILYGGLKKFPYTEADGVFEVLFDARDVELFYFPGWPRFSGVDAKVLFLGNGMEVVSDNWNLFGATVKNAAVSIPSFKDSTHLLVRGRVEGEIRQTLDFLQNTPLKTHVNPVVGVLDAKGSNSIELDLKIPIKPNATVKVDGSARLEKAGLSVVPVGLPVESLGGELKFDEQGVFADGLVGNALGYPVKADIKKSEGTTRISVAGRADVINLQTLFPGEWWKLAKGQSRYDVNISVHPDRPVEMEIVSDLKELSLQLPERLGKTAEETRPLRLTFRFEGASSVPATFNYADEFKGALVIDAEKKKLRSGHFLVGGGKVGFPQEPEVKFVIDRKRFDLDGWQGSGDIGERGMQGLLAGIGEISVHASRLEWKKRDLGAFDLRLKKKDGRWQGFFTSRFGAGNIQLPPVFDKSEIIRLNLNYLNLSGLTEFGAGSDSLPDKWQSLPRIDLNSDQLHWRSVDLGKLNLETENDGDGSKIRKLRLKSDNLRLNCSGDWRIRNHLLETRIQGRLEVDNLGDFLTRVNITDEIKGAESLFDFSLQWRGMPYDFSIRDVRGNIDAQLREGSILGIEPGIGRMLGAFDLAEWKRRIRLDFSDMYAEGLAFDSMKGSFGLEDGYVNAERLVIDGVSAKIEIQGKTGLVTRDFDQTVTVTPKSSAVIPFAGTIAGFVVKTLTGSHPDSLTSTQYAIKGKWDEPEIIRLHEYDGALRKAWTGVTGSSGPENQEKKQ
ncbi:MAG: YhdP family protein [Gammaproteobacteria bacterium]